MDGTGLRQLTELGGPYVQTPRWSPDGQRIVFCAPVHGRFDLFSIDAQGGAAHRLTTSESNDVAPAWSPDGLRLYFGSDRQAGWAVFELTLATGGIKRVTANSAIVSQVAPAGRLLYYIKPDQKGLWRISLDEKESAESCIVDDLMPVDWNNWLVTPASIFYVRRRQEGNPELMRHDLTSGESRRVSFLAGLYFKSGIWVDDQESTLIFSTIETRNVDLQLIDR